MVDAGKITLRVEVDAKEFERFMQSSPKNMNNFKKSVDAAEVGTKKLGDTATTTAVRFQTLTQGTINLVTSFTQAYTSISNLQKAKTSLQAAAVGVERAIDLQKRKQFMLNEEMAKAAPNLKKVELLTNELATAHDDLAVKQQRVKDQADQVNDTYILFGLNIANVGFSAVQTGVSMIKMAEGVKIATVASKVFNLTTAKWTLVAIAAIAAWEGIAYAVGHFNKELGESISIFKNVTRLMDEFTGASDITLDNYNSKISGVTTSTTDFEDSWKSMTSTVKKETDAQTDLVKHWERQYKTSVANIQIEMGRQKQLTQTTTGGSQGNFPNAQQGSIEAQVQETDKKVKSLFNYIFPNIPVSHAEEQIKQTINTYDDNVQRIKESENYRGSDYSALKNVLTPELYLSLYKGNVVSDKSTVKEFIKFKSPGIAGFFGHERVAGTISTPDYIPPAVMNFEPSSGLEGIPSEADRIRERIQLLKWQEQELMNDFERSGGNVVWTWYTAAGNTALEIIELESELDVLNKKNPKIQKDKPISTEERNLEFMSTFIDENTPAYRLRLGSMSSQTRHLFNQRKDNLKQIALDKFANETFGRNVQLGTQTFRVGKTSDRIGGVFHAGLGSNLMAMTQNKGGTFGMGNRLLGTSEGNMIEALRQAQMATIDPNATRNTNLATHTMAQFNAMNAGGNTSDMSRFRGQVRPSQTLEILRRNAKTLADNKLRNQIIDRNTNALRFGGTRVPGMEMWEEGAVRGGYSSRQAYSRAALQKRSDSWKQSQIFADYFSGIGRVSSYTGMSDLRGQLGGIHARATEVKETMSMAGLSYKTFNARTGLPYRHSAHQYYQFMRDWNEVRSFNDNELARARQINLLHYEYGIGTFKGSSMPLSALQDRVTVEDQKMQTLGLTRSEAIAIVGTEGRGRTEIDDRLRFSDTLEAISSGTSPL